MHTRSLLHTVPDATHPSSQDDLRKQNYTSLPSLLSALEACDRDGIGYLGADQLRLVCHSVELPLSDQLVDGAIMK